MRLEAARGCGGERPRSRGGFASVETLNIIEKSRAARLAGSRDLYRALSRRIITLLRRDKETYVRSIAEDVEGYLNANDLKPAYRAMKKLHSKSTSQVSVIRIADGCLVSDADGQMARWIEYFEQSFKVNPPNGKRQTAKLRGGKAADICNISIELLKAGGRGHDQWVACFPDCCMASRYHSF